MGIPRPTRKMYGYFTDDRILPAEVRGQNVFVSTEEGYLFSPTVGKPLKQVDFDALVARGLAVRDEQFLHASAGKAKSWDDKGGSSPMKTALLILGVLFMLAVNAYVILGVGR